MLAAGCRLYIDVLIASEFVNTYARLKWKQLAPTTREYKRFRQSSMFRPVAQEIANSLKRVVSHCERLESGFAAVDVAALIAEFSAAASDFNDQVIAALCEREGLALVTHDADFKGTNVTILTANQNLLS
jgi:predicted nucleic acid-binding protein